MLYGYRLMAIPPEWDDTVVAGRLFHRAAWLRIWSELYGREVRALQGDGWAMPAVRIARPWGGYWSSMPYFDAAGPIGDVEHAALSRELSGEIEVRADRPLWDDVPVERHKVGVLLDLTDDLLQQYPKKVRSQVRRGLKESPEVGSDVAGFHRVYVARMRDLGSPPHGVALFRRILEEFADEARVVVLRLEGRPVSAALLLRDGDTMCIPWAATEPAAMRVGMNMVLYYEAMSLALREGASVFDFGRCNVGSTQLKFKLQWGGRERPLYWYRINGSACEGREPSWKRRAVISVWRRLPVPVVRAVGARAVRWFS